MSVTLDREVEKLKLSAISQRSRDLKRCSSAATAKKVKLSQLNTNRSMVTQMQKPVVKIPIKSIINGEKLRSVTSQAIFGSNSKNSRLLP